jgi:hypothetical protein
MLARGVAWLTKTGDASVFEHNFLQSFQEVSNVVRDNDIILLDIDDDSHTNPVFTPLYQHIERLQHTRNCLTVLIRSAINMDIHNRNLIDDQPIPQADNSLLTAYTNYNFSAFGDFAGIKKDALTEGGTISPGVIYYSWQNNCYIGFRGRTQDITEFTNHIVPSLMASAYLLNYSRHHQHNCPGCMIIRSIAAGGESGDSQAKWKRISSMHYVYTMEEFL